jgi:ABC-type branched-subunit amino acid transport system ATPase component
MHQRVQRGLVRTYQRPIVPSMLTVGETLTAARKALRRELSTASGGHRTRLSQQLWHQGRASWLAGFRQAGQSRSGTNH